MGVVSTLNFISALAMVQVVLSTLNFISDLVIVHVSSIPVCCTVFRCSQSSHDGLHVVYRSVYTVCDSVCRFQMAPALPTVGSTLDTVGSTLSALSPFKWR